MVQIFANGDVVYAQTSEVLTMKNRVEPPKQSLSYSSQKLWYWGKRINFNHFWLRKSKVLILLIFECNLR